MLSQFRRLPLITALVAFALYVCTMGGGVTFNSLPLVAGITGWNTIPFAGQPLYWLLTLPLHLLPAAWVPLAVKLFAAAIAAAVLGLLARVVQLLPWDHPWDAARPFAAVLPALTACVMCGLEFSYWREATSSFGELVDLLMLASAVWLLLEFRVRRDARWLDAATVVWGLGMAENWLMLVALPVFIAGVIWLMGIRFFRWNFVLRLTALGLAGFSIYVLLPMVNGLSPYSPWTFGHAWLASLRDTKEVAVMIYYGFWRGHRLLFLAVIIYGLVPTLPLLIRMRDGGTSNISGVDQFQLWIYRTLRVGLLFACFWLALDPVIGARQMIHQQMNGLWLPMLSFDYLNALGAAFLVGNLLLISQPVAARDGLRRSRSKFPWARLAVPVAAAALGIAAGSLALRNAPAIWRSNTHPIEQFGATAVNSLPPGPGIIFGDFPQELEVFQAALAHRPDAASWVVVDTKALSTVAYRAHLQKLHPDGWLTDTNRHELSPYESLRLLQELARTNRLFYLNPSYGLFFERFYLQPAGAIFEMKLRGRDPLDVPPVPAAVADANEQLWTTLWDKKLAALVPPAKRPGIFEEKMARYGLAPAPRLTDHLGDWFSISLDAWAVTLQKLGRYREAQVRFQQALQLNTNNLSARISLACNTNLQAGLAMGLAEVPKVAAQLGNLERLNQIRNGGGPFDEPTIDYLQGSSYLDQGLLFQAAEQLERARALAPGSLMSEMALVEIYNRLQMPARSRPLIADLREETKKLPSNSSLDLNLALLDSYSSYLQTNVAKARSALQSVVEQHPDDPQIARRVLAAYLSIGDVTNALQIADAQLAKSPDDVTGLNNKAVILIQAGRAAEAFSLLDRVLSLTNQPAARMNRALAHLAKDDFALAASDLHQLEQDGYDSPMVSFGLAVVAQHASDTNQAMRYFQLCLTNAPIGSPLWLQASNRLYALQPRALAR